MDNADHEDMDQWFLVECNNIAHNTARIYERVAARVRDLEDENADLRGRLAAGAQESPVAEVRRLHEENAALRAGLATAARAKDELASERDRLLRRLESILRLADVTHLDDAGPSGAPSTDTDISGSNSTIRPRPRSLARTLSQRSLSLPRAHSPSRSPARSPARTERSVSRSEISEPATEVTTRHDTVGRPIRSQPASLAAPAASQPLSAQSSATLIDGAPQPLAPAALGPPFVDVRVRALAGSPVRRPPSAGRLAVLNASPAGMSDGLSVQYEGSSAAAGGAALKWRIHFAKPPPSLGAGSALGPVKTAALVERLGLDEVTRKSIEDLSTLRTGSLKLHINNTTGLAFLYDPILLESPDKTYVVEWGHPRLNRNATAYIAQAREAHAALHTLIYASKKNGWYYLGQQRWEPVDINPIWPILTLHAQRALASRRAHDVNAAEMTEQMSAGQIAQLTIELHPTSLLGPNQAESAIMRRLREPHTSLQDGSMAGARN
ncbi:hypothetical protein BC834DRAFT_879774 [Gloeopeniophorella convolvens]|nr:hypothetical protein BC834DRAFT_879774 [Gloeopeniophorella convolvens]